MKLPESYRRFAPLAAGAVLLLVGTVISALVWPRWLGSPPIVGTSLHDHPAPDFRLVNAQNRPVSLASLRGKTVALTFLYTDCPDLCPLTTQKFQQVYNQLGADRSKVALVAITVDPETDTPQRIAQYSQAMGMQGKWQFLTGTRAELTPIWRAYGVAPLSPDQASLLLQQGPSAAQNNPAFQVAHSLVVYVIDPLGRERVLLDPDFTVPQLLDDVRAVTAGA
jgi:protein SCO1/2